MVSNKVKVLVTGGAGFIGSHIVDTLVQLGYQVRVIDDFSAGRKENLQGVIKRIELIRGDIRKASLVRRAMRKVKYVFHQAALRSVPKSMDNPSGFNEVNVRGTLNLLLAARDAKVKRFVFASSSSIYGETNRLPEKESHPPDPISPYAATKLMGEVYCRIFSVSFGLATVALRYFNVFGPRQSLESEYAVVVPKFIACLMKDKPTPINDDGKQSRDFTYVADVVKANLLAMRASKKATGQVFNVACGRRHSVLELSQTINRLMGKNIKPVFLPPRPGDVKHTMADISRAKKYLRFRPGVSFQAGLKKTIQYFLENPPN